MVLRVSLGLVEVHASWSEHSEFIKEKRRKHYAMATTCERIEVSISSKMEEDIGMK